MTAAPARLVRAARDWRASYADPIRVAEGEAVHLTGRSEDWEGSRWLWARAGDGREGWLPAGRLEIAGGTARARRAFDAAELTCRAGETLEALDATHGWTLCRARDGRAGWVPDTHIDSAATCRASP